jgi:hypothetical protein
VQESALKAQKWIQEKTGMLSRDVRLGEADVQPLFVFQPLDVYHKLNGVRVNYLRIVDSI